MSVRRGRRRKAESALGSFPADRASRRKAEPEHPRALRCFPAPPRGLLGRPIQIHCLPTRGGRSGRNALVRRQPDGARVMPRPRTDSGDGRPLAERSVLFIRVAVIRRIGQRRRRPVTREVDGGNSDAEVSQDVDPTGLPPVVVEGGSKAVQQDQRARAGDHDPAKLMGATALARVDLVQPQRPQGGPGRLNSLATLGCLAAGCRTLGCLTLALISPQPKRSSANPTPIHSAEDHRQHPRAISTR